MKAFLAAIMLTATVATASADTIYSYTGDTLRRAFGAYTTADRISGSFTVPDGFAPAQSCACPLDYTSVPYTFTDGHQTLTPANSSAELLFDPNGVWRITLLGIDGGRIITNTIWDRYDRAELDVTNFGVNACACMGFSDGSHAGTWTATVPEPASLLLVVAGLVAIAALAPRRP